MYLRRSALALSVGTGIVIALGVFAQTWQGPSATPPGSNISAPLNVGTGAQTKQGSLKATDLEATTGDVKGVRLCIGADCKDAWPVATSAPASQWTTSGTNVYYSGGNVGIGTNVPGYALDVSSTSNAFRVGNTNSWFKVNTGGNSRVSLGDGAAHEAGFIAGGHNTALQNTITIASCTDSGSCPAYTTFLENGNVGIGTATPNKQLHVKTASGNAEIDIQSAANPWWGMYQEAGTGQLRFWNGNDRLTITPAGNVGIGTVTPTTTLDVAGSGRIVGNTTSGALTVMQNGTGPAMYILGYGGGGPALDVKGTVRLGDSSSVNALDVWSNKGVSISNDTSYSRANVPGGNLIVQGNVGIGTTSPAQKLDVNGAVKATQICLGTSPCTSSWPVGGVATETDPTVQPWAKTANPTTFTGNVTMPGTGIWNTSGNVGIGTTNPVSTLHVAGGQTYLAPTMASAAALDVNQLGTSGIAAIFRGGNVGIGITNPSERLHVVGRTTLQADSTFLYGKDAAGNYRFALNNDAGSTLNFYGSDSGWFPFMTVNNAGGRQVSFNSGNVGIGTTAPTQKLDVVGNVKGSGLCIGLDCRTSWPATGASYIGTAPITVSGTMIGLGLPSTGCSSQQALKWNGSAWVCAPDIDTNTTYTVTAPIALSGTNISLTGALAGTGCSSGQVLKWSGSTWACTNTVVDTNSGGTITSVAAGTGLTGGGTSGGVTLGLDASHNDGSAYDTRFVNASGDTMTGSLTLQGGDLLMTTGKAIRVDNNGPTQLHIGNWGGTTGVTPVNKLLLSLDNGDFSVSGSNASSYVNVGGAGSLYIQGADPTILLRDSAQTINRLSMFYDHNANQSRVHSYSPLRITSDNSVEISSSSNNVKIIGNTKVIGDVRANNLLWTKVDEQQMWGGSSGDGIFIGSGLNAIDGNSDQMYKLVFQGNLVASGADRRILIRPNGVGKTTGGYKSYAAMDGDAASGEWDTTGFYVGRNGWGQDADFSFEYTISAVTGRKRVGFGNAIFAMSGGNIIGYNRTGGSWTNTSTNITSLWVGPTGGVMNGTLTLFALKKY